MAKDSVKIPKRATRVSKAEWLKAALDELERGGIDSVRVERLAEDLLVSKSGFYWHFKDRSDLLLQMLDYWSSEFTKSVTADLKALQGGPMKRLEDITRKIHAEELGKYDLAFRAWAKCDNTAAHVVREVTKIRYDFIRGMFAELGFEGDDLEARARLYVCYLSMEGAVFSSIGKRKRLRIQQRQLNLLTREQP